MRYRRKPRYIEALTFDELVEFGKAHAESENDGPPLSFKYNGCQITYKNDNCYIVTYYHRDHDMTREDMLIPDGSVLMVMELDVFNYSFELDE